MGSDDPNNPGPKRNRAKTVVEADMPDIGGIFKEAQAANSPANDPWGGSGQDWGAAPTQPPMTPPAPADDPWATPSDRPPMPADDPWATPASPPAAGATPPASAPPESPPASDWGSSATDSPAPSTSDWGSPPASASNSDWGDSGAGAPPSGAGAPPPSGAGAPPPSGAGAPPPSNAGGGAPPPSTAMQTTGGGGDDFSPQEIQAGKTMAVISHAGNIFCLPLFIIPLIQRDNRFALFHAKQAGAGWAAIVAMVVLNSTVAFIPIVGFATCLTGPLSFIAIIAIGGYFAYLANEGKSERLPVVGELAEDVLSNVQAPNQLGG